MSRRRIHQTTVPGERPRGPVDDIAWLVLFWVCGSRCAASSATT